MASNASKLWNKVSGGYNKVTNWSAKHPVKSGLAALGTSVVNPFVGPQALGTWVYSQFKDPSKSSKTKTKKKVSYNGGTTDYSSLVDDASAYGGSGSGGGYGSSYSSGAPDISGLLAAYDQQADASRKIAQNAYDTTRNDLLTSLKRFQEQNAKDVENQKQGYLAEQSSLDYAREQANRQNRIAASSRGLGGSGLQQLAQLQTLMSQGEDISNAAASNQKAMDALRQALQQKEDDTNTNLAKAQTTLSDALTKIEAELAQQKAEAIYNNISASRSGGGSGGGSGSGGGYGDGFDPYFQNVLDDLNAELQSYAGMTPGKLRTTLNSRYGTTSSYGTKYGNVNSMAQARNVLGRVALDRIGSQVYDGMSSAAYNNAKSRAQSMVNSLQSKKTTTKKKTTKKKK